MRFKVTLVTAVTALRRRLAAATAPYVLFPAIGVLILGVIWGTTLNLVHVQRVGAERAAVAATQKLAETYEAQVVRAMGQIDQTMQLVKYAYEIKDARINLSALKSANLLPPDLLFVVSVADARGDVVSSTRPFEATNVAEQDYFQVQRGSDTLAVGRPWRNPGSEEWMLQFSRGLKAADGTFAGVVMIAVPAEYFVSSYDPMTLGDHGVLAVLGTDGVFRARRTGESVSAGDTLDYASVRDTADDIDSGAVLTANTWDGVRRYTSTIRLFDVPLTVIVGLSEDEQLAVAHRNIRQYLWLATAGSFLLILVIAILGRMSWKLEQARLRQLADQVAHAQRVEYLAYHDGLTGLPNRSLFSRLLIQSINEAHRYNRKLAVLFLDLDHFKSINDTLGHEAGDQLLQQVAEKLKACLRASDAVARLGGDEYVVLLPEVAEQEYVATAARKILSIVAKPFVLLGQEFSVTASVGISIYPQDGLDEQMLTKNADIAMYRAKEEGRNKFQFFSEALNTVSLERLALESALRNALERHEFELHYQAKRDMRSGLIKGMEALLRWNHPDLGMLLPMRFVPLADEMGLMVPIGKWVITAACLQNIAWQSQGLPRLNVSVNLTARQLFDDGLLTGLASIFKETGMDPSLLELEFAESMLMHDVKKSVDILTKIKRMKVRIAIDDFGMGYFSLSNIERFPLDTIKIDRSLIHEVANNVQHKDLTAAIIAMGGALSLTVVAQGVETKEQADFLRSHACDQLQGFYFNEPLPAGKFAQLLQAPQEMAGIDKPPADRV